MVHGQSLHHEFVCINVLIFQIEAIENIESTVQYGININTNGTKCVD